MPSKGLCDNYTIPRGYVNAAEKFRIPGIKKAGARHIKGARFSNNHLIRYFR